jgi:hypothetical protein
MIAKLASMTKSWGTTLAERQREYPCDQVVPDPNAMYYRGVSVKASPTVLFRWLCQMRAAPYSYDWLDNFGRRSPQSLIAGLDELEAGQSFMRIFDLVDFVRDEHVTLRIKRGSPGFRMFGDLAVTYLVDAQGASGCRLLVKLAVRYPKGLYGRFLGVFLPLGDFVMMRRQLLNLKRLAERA